MRENREEEKEEKLKSNARTLCLYIGYFGDLERKNYFKKSSYNSNSTYLLLWGVQT